MSNPSFTYQVSGEVLTSIQPVRSLPLKRSTHLGMSAAWVWLNKKMNHIVDSGADVLIANDLGCIIHMQGGLRRKGINIKVKHIAEIIDDCN